MMYTYRVDHFELTIVHVFSSHVCLVAAAFNSAGLDDGGKPWTIK